MPSILQCIEERQRYLDSMQLYHEELSALKTLLSEKEKILEELLGEPAAQLALKSITSDLERRELPIPRNRIEHMDTYDRRYVITKIAKNNLIIHELEQKIKELQQHKK